MDDHRLHGIVLALLFVLGCSGSVDEVPGRIGIDVTLTIDGQPAEDGTLILRPAPEVACPLVKLAIQNGKGTLSRNAGPVPGQWTATFRSNADGSLTEQLEASGRSNPVDQAGTGQFRSGGSKNRSPPKPAVVLIPKDDPAAVKIDMVRSRS